MSGTMNPLPYGNSKYAQSPASQSMAQPASQTLYVPIESPPTPAPSPGPHNVSHPAISDSQQSFSAFPPVPLPQNPTLRRQYLTSILSSCTPSELLFISTTIAPLLKRDFLHNLPPELALHILGFIDDPKTLVRASRVSRSWMRLVGDESVWKRMSGVYAFDLDADFDGELELDGETGFDGPRMPNKGRGKGKMKEKERGKETTNDSYQHEDEPLEEMEQFATFPMDPALEWLSARKRRALRDQATSTQQPMSPSFLTSNRLMWRRHFKMSYSTMMNWRHGGTLLRAHRLPVQNPDGGVVTSLAIDADWVIAGLANSRIHVFSARTGVLARTLVGHELGVWAVCLVSKGGVWGGDGSDLFKGKANRPPTNVKGGKGRKSKRDLARDDLSAGIDRMNLDSSSGPTSAGLDHLVPPSLRVGLGLDGPGAPPTDTPYTEEDEGVFDEDADADSEGKGEGSSGVPRRPGPDGYRPGSGRGKRRMRTKQSDACGASEGWGQPNSLIVSGGCDKVLRVWDVRSGYCVYALPGHTSTIRCIKVLHNRPIAVTGSRDSTLRVWDVRKGIALRVLEGHTSSVRCLDVCGSRVVSGSYDTTCRVWDVDTGVCIHVLRGHFHQIYSVAFDGVRIASGGLDTTVRVWDAETGICIALLQGHTALVCQLQLSPTILATGGSDGRVITFSLSTYTAVHKIAAHDSSVTSLQFDKHFLVTGGNDGRVRLFDTQTGGYVRELSEGGESVWKVGYRKDTCAVMCKRAGKTVMEIWSLKPKDE